MRFIINFFLFGFLFYLIYIFFPDAFHTLVSWATTVYDFLGALYHTISEKIGWKRPETAPEHAQQAMFYLLTLTRSHLN